MRNEVPGCIDPADDGDEFEAGLPQTYIIVSLHQGPLSILLSPSTCLPSPLESLSSFELSTGTSVYVCGVGVGGGCVPDKSYM